MNRNLGLEQAFQPAGYGDFPGARTNAGLKSPPTPQPGKAARQIAWCFFIALSQMMAADRASSERQIPPPGISIPPDARLELEEGCIHLAGAIALSGMACLRSGAGLVKLAVPDCILDCVAGFEHRLETYVPGVTLGDRVHCK